MSDLSDEDEYPRSSRESQPHRVAKKSTTASTLNNSFKPVYQTRRLNTSGNPKVNLAKDRFLENFNPETSLREKRKLSRKINPPSNVRRPPGALYDDNGIHIATYSDLCDCLNEDCIGCFFPCSKCGSLKCGIDCRVHRKFVYDQIEYHGYDIVVKNPLVKN